jgi:transglutaminase-like putative cysteine protease
MKIASETLIVGAVFFCLLTVVADAVGKEAEREFLVQETIVATNLTTGAKNLRIWVPYPANDAWQEVEDFSVRGEFDIRFVRDAKSRNIIAYLVPKKSIQNKKTAAAMVSFRVKRREYEGDTSTISQKEKQYYLRGDTFVPVGGEMEKVADKITAGKTSEEEKVRAIYEYLIAELTYSKDNPKICGIGNSFLTLRHKKGICTDYHSLFISLVRSLGIPAKFEIGFGVPENLQEGQLKGYHCWTKVYLEDKGWIGVDVSEADKHPEKKEYFFGHLDEDRIHLVTGRDIKLPYSSTEPLNYFVLPLAEIEGAVFPLDIEVSFRELDRKGEVER